MSKLRKFESEWTFEQMATLQKMWAEGATNSEIGRALGKKRGAVAGKIHRNKMKWKVPSLSKEENHLITKATTKWAEGHPKIDQKFFANLLPKDEET